jgi:hypothetical protein
MDMYLGLGGESTWEDIVGALKGLLAEHTGYVYRKGLVIRYWIRMSSYVVLFLPAEVFSVSTWCTGLGCHTCPEKYLIRGLSCVDIGLRLSQSNGITAG